MKKFLITVFLLSSILPTYASGGTIVTYVIDPEKNAYLHNNKGVEYVKEQCYYAAIQEFKMAISLNPQKQATAIYFNNLGKVYMTIGYPELALDCFNNAITQYSLNFEYYQNLADCYKKLGQSKSKLQYYRSSTSNPLNKVMTGLLYEQTGDKKKAIIVLDDFATSEPDLLITPAVKNYIQQIVKDLQK